MFPKEYLLLATACLGLACHDAQAKTWSWDDMLVAAEFEQYHAQAHQQAQSRIVDLQAQQQLLPWGGDWSVQAQAVPLEQTSLRVTNTLSWHARSGVDSKIIFENNDTFHWSVQWPWSSRQDYQQQNQDIQLKRQAYNIEQKQAFSEDMLALLQQYAQWWSAYQQYSMLEEKQKVLATAHQAQQVRWEQGRISEHELHQSQWDVDNGAMLLNWARDKQQDARKQLSGQWLTQPLTEQDVPLLNVEQLPLLMPFDYYQDYSNQSAFLWTVQNIEKAAWRLDEKKLKTQGSLPISMVAKGNQDYSEVGLQVNWTFKDRSKLKQATELEKAQAVLMSHRHEEQASKLTDQIQQSWQAANQKKVALKHIVQQLTLSKQNLEEVLLLIDMGRRPSSDRQMALMSWSTSQQVYLDACMDYLMHWANLMHVVGGLNEQWLYQDEFNTDKRAVSD